MNTDIVLVLGFVLKVICITVLTRELSKSWEQIASLWDQAHLSYTVYGTISNFSQPSRRNY